MAKGITKRPKSLEARIRKFYDLLPESERRIADFILDFPGEIAAYSATELSQFSGGSKAAMTRLVHRLGFRKFRRGPSDCPRRSGLGFADVSNDKGSSTRLIPRAPQEPS